MANSPAPNVKMAKLKCEGAERRDLGVDQRLSVQTFLGFVPVVLQKIFGSTRRSFVADRKSAYDSSVHQVRRIDLLERKGSEDMPHL